MTNFEQALRKRMYRGDCPSAETLHDYYWHEIAAESVPTIVSHLAQCPDCADEYADLVAFLAPESAGARQRSFGERLRTFIGQLPSAAGLAVRGDSGSMIYESPDGNVIFLNWKRDEQSRYRLDGKLFPPMTEQIENGVQLVGAMGGVAADLQASEFIFSELEAGRYQILLQLPDRQILIPHVEITATG